MPRSVGRVLKAKTKYFTAKPLTFIPKVQQRIYSTVTYCCALRTYSTYSTCSPTRRVAVGAKSSEKKAHYYHFFQGIGGPKSGIRPPRTDAGNETPTGSRGIQAPCRENLGAWFPVKNAVSTRTPSTRPGRPSLAAAAAVVQTAPISERCN